MLHICLYVVRYICLYIHICFNIQLKKQTSSPIETSYQFIFANDFRVLNIQQLISFRKRINTSSFCSPPNPQNQTMYYLISLVPVVWCEVYIQVHTHPVFCPTLPKVVESCLLQVEKWRERWSGRCKDPQDERSADILVVRPSEKSRQAAPSGGENGL